jgi:hypothetical protein
MQASLIASDVSKTQEEHIRGLQIITGCSLLYTFQCVIEIRLVVVYVSLMGAERCDVPTL